MNTQISKLGLWGLLIGGLIFTGVYTWRTVVFAGHHESTADPVVSNRVRAFEFRERLQRVEDAQSRIVRGRVRATQARWKLNPQAKRLEQIISVKFDPAFEEPPHAIVALTLVQSATTADVSLPGGKARKDGMEIVFIAGDTDDAAILDAEYLVIPKNLGNNVKMVDHQNGNRDCIVSRDGKIIQKSERWMAN